MKILAKIKRRKLFFRYFLEVQGGWLLTSCDYNSKLVSGFDKEGEGRKKQELIATTTMEANIKPLSKEVTVMT